MTSAIRLEEQASISQQSKHGATPNPTPAAGYNPYLAARREWDERYGHLITRERNWRLMALISALIALRRSAE